MVNVSKFVSDHVPLCVCLGIAILGYLGYHAVQWIIDKCTKTEQIDRVGQRTISSASSQRVAPRSNQITTPQVLPLPQMTAPRQSEEVQVDEIALQQQSEARKTSAATKIQSVFRGHKARLALKQMQVEKLEEKKSAAATKIQSVWRGHLAKIKLEKGKKRILDYDLLEKAKPYIDVPSNRQDVPRASSGKTPIYLPKDLPIVLKQIGSPENQKRFDQMRQGRDICEKNSYEHLVIPKARVYGNFIVESRLPISAHGTKEQIGLYIENRDRFAGAVKEFTGFLCQSTFEDITGTNYPYGTLSKTPVGRYDKIALYLEEDQGKIGLIDLERFKPGCIILQKEWCFFQCRDAVHLFPYHLDEIMSVAKRFDPDIESYRGNLELERAEALKLFKLAYEDHLEFVRQKGITAENPLEIVEITSARRERIKEAMIVLIRNEHDEEWYKNCLGEKPEEAIVLFENFFPEILDSATAFLSEMIKRRIDSAKEPISSSQQLVSYRTLFFSSSSKWYRNLQEKVASKLQMIKTESEWNKKGFASLIIQGVFDELAKGGEIAYYNRSFVYAMHCIFC